MRLLNNVLQSILLSKPMNNFMCKPSRERVIMVLTVIWMRLKKLIGLKYLNSIQKVIIKTAFTHTPYGREAALKESRREREWYDTKNNIKFEDFI